MTVDENSNGAESTEGNPETKAEAAPEVVTTAEENVAEEVEEELDPLEEALANAAQMKEKLMRTAADFDNFRKRSRREVTDAEKKGRDSLLNSLLPIFDNLERATAHATSDKPEASSEEESSANMKGLVDGIHLVMKQFRDALSRQGIERVESVGQPFDPSVHEAIQHLETNDVPPGCIAAEVQPGYRQGDRLVRPAMVVVAKALSKAAEEPAAEAESDSAPASASEVTEEDSPEA